MARVVRLLGAAFLLAGWIGLGLALALVTLDASRYEGYRPDPSELINAATLVAAVAGLLLGYVHGVRTREPGGVPGVPRRLAVLLAVAAVVAALHLLANDLLYRYVVPLPADLRNNRTSPVGLVVSGLGFPLLAALLGFGVGLLRRRVTGSAPTDAGRPASTWRWWVLVVAVGAVGLFTAPEFVRVGAELATTRFGGSLASTASGERATVWLPSGRYAVYRSYGGTMSAVACELTGPDGRALALARPAVVFTDNSDSAVTMLLGTFDLDSAGEVSLSCRDRPGDTFDIGFPPRIRGPLEPLVYAPTAVLPGIGLLPGVVAAGVLLVRRRPPRLGAPEGPGGEPQEIAHTEPPSRDSEGRGT
ncbi:hypothetical protein [Micromonospora sp. HM5-17]|uniref:hypothetical protein n=1 Tax=Micromonospora sp. HM5-17 TaxID=2487710 RepID=UPI000F466C47|nr:hypothetical protein [Micromonospora sp. HM5-17]ROT26274.1 hypothetical protein EF879_25860 [Micromonospora sp. HM5-17]